MHIFISYATKNTPYEQVIKDYFIKSVQALNLSYYVSYIPDFGTHQKNANYKPRFIQHVLEQTESDIVFLDADAEVLQYPILFDTLDCDLACHLLDWGTWYGHSVGKKELLPGTLYVKNNDKMKKLMKNWADAAENSPLWDGVILYQMINQNSNYKFAELPLSYCYIKTLPNGQKPKVTVLNPTIVHNQVSRQYRNKK